MVSVAQLVRAPGCGPGGRGFKSPRSPLTINFRTIETVKTIGTDQSVPAVYGMGMV